MTASVTSPLSPCGSREPTACSTFASPFGLRLHGKPQRIHNPGSRLQATPVRSIYINRFGCCGVALRVTQ